MSADNGSLGRPLSLTVWYPATAGGAAEDVGGNAVFVGSPAFRDAPVSDMISPLVILSHGGLRSARDSGAWLSRLLVPAGFIVAEVNGPRPDRASGAVDEIWRRPEDVSRALDQILEDSFWSTFVDRSRISVVGYALGGTAAVALSGGNFETAAFARACETVENGPDCAWFAAQDVSLASVDRAALERSHHDPRISAAVVIDPEYPTVFSGDSLKALGESVLLMTLGDTETVWSDEVLANGANAVISDATSYDGFSVCTEKGKAILLDDGGDPALCGATSADRSQVHQDIASQIRAFLTQ